MGVTPPGRMNIGDPFIQPMVCVWLFEKREP